MSGYFLISTLLNPLGQAVVVNVVISAVSPVISAVPQGTVVAPVLLLPTYMMDDIANGVSPSTRVSSFMDDTRVNKGIAHHDIDCPTGTHQSFVSGQTL